MHEDRQPPSWLGDVSDGVAAWTQGRVDQQHRAVTPVGARRTAPDVVAGADRQPPPEDTAALVPEADAEAVARKILLDALTGRACSRDELRQKLAKKNVPDHLAETLLDRFTEVGLIDDSAFAEAWVMGRHRSRGLAPRALAQELRRKGIDDDTAREALDLVDEDDQRTRAVELVQRKLRSVATLERDKATRRLVGMLARKGYSAGLAFSVVKQALDLDSDSDRWADTGAGEVFD